MKNITYDYYRIFYFVAKYQSISLAARYLNSNQPNISQYMHRLEKQIGYNLLKRSHRGIVLTNEGQLLYKHISIAYKQIKEAENELNDLNSFNSGSLKLCTTDIALHCLLLKKLQIFKENYPKIHLSITNQGASEAITSLKEGLCDLALISGPISLSKEIKSTKIIRFKEILLGKKNTIPNKINIEQISNYPLISLNTKTNTREYYNKIFIEHKIEFNPTIEVASADLILPLIKAGLGCGFLPTFMANEEINKGNIKEIKVNALKIERDILLLENKNNNLSKSASELKRILLSNN